MASAGVGYRTAGDVLCEMSLHLLQEIVLTTTSAPVVAGSQTVPVGSTTAMYVGAEVAVEPYTALAEVVTIAAVSPGVSFTAVFANAHASGVQVIGATFPTQEQTDPIFTQSEMLGYLSRANNEYLSKCPVSYALAAQNLTFGQVYQNTPNTCIEINRIAVSTYYCQLVSLTRVNDVVTVVAASPHGLVQDSTFSVQNSTAGFSGAFAVATVVNATTFTYVQIASDGTTTGGAIISFSRIYETTSAEITMADRNWKNSYVNTPTAWAEDRAGLYRWLINGKASSNFPCELLMSVRDEDSLTLLSGFLVPDTLVPYLKYKALAYAFMKDGIMQDQQRAAYCESRFDRGVAATNRFLLGFQVGLKGAA